MEYESDAEVVARKAMAIAADLCVYTNDTITIEALESAT
jgi:ATP-dependent HslUV protease subunit HslV